MGPKFKKPTVAERCLPWRRDRNGRPISLYRNHNCFRIEPSYQVFACIYQQQISSPTSPETRCLPWISKTLFFVQFYFNPMEEQTPQFNAIGMHLYVDLIPREKLQFVPDGKLLLDDHSIF